NGAVRDAADIRRNLGAQLTTPVRYSELIARLAAEQPTVFVEIGPQQMLTRLNRRILPAQADVIASDNPKRPGREPLLCVQAPLECVGVLRAVANSKPVTAPRAESRARVITPPSAKPASEERPMNDSIPHFDATERRRAKMRGGANGKPAAASNGESHAPA